MTDARESLFPARECVYCGQQRRLDDEPIPATHRARWTVYGGATKTVYICEKHAAVARGQRGIELDRLCPHGRACPEGRLCACSMSPKALSYES